MLFNKFLGHSMSTYPFPFFIMKGFQYQLFLIPSKSKLLMLLAIRHHFHIATRLARSFHVNFSFLFFHHKRIPIPNLFKTTHNKTIAIGYKTISYSSKACSAISYPLRWFLHLPNQPILPLPWIINGSVQWSNVHIITNTTNFDQYRPLKDISI